VYDFQIVFSGIFPTGPHLSINAGVTLIVAGISGVNNCLFHILSTSFLSIFRLGVPAPGRVF
jgi:hypothetical protein